MYLDNFMSAYIQFSDNQYRMEGVFVQKISATHIENKCIYLRNLCLKYHFCFLSNKFTGAWEYVHCTSGLKIILYKKI
jgi:hypothetical protein